MAIIAYTDGSSLGNPGPGGYGTILLETEKKIKKESIVDRYVLVESVNN